MSSLYTLRAQATEARDYAHAAYTIALSSGSDTEAAWQALLHANRVLHHISQMITDQISGARS